MPIRHLINGVGTPFEDEEIDALTVEMEALSLEDRKAFRNANAQAAADHPAKQMLIVARPRNRQEHAVQTAHQVLAKRKADRENLGAELVRKLVADLQSDIQADAELTDEQKQQVDVLTLHKYARSVVEQNHGTLE